jgi:hypothetical protein
MALLSSNHRCPKPCIERRWLLDELDPVVVAHGVPPFSNANGDESDLPLEKMSGINHVGASVALRSCATNRGRMRGIK